VKLQTLVVLHGKGRKAVCPVCGHEFEPGEEAIRSHTSTGTKFFCVDHYYADRRA